MRLPALALFALGGAAFAADGALTGFDAEGSARQRALEAELDARIDAREMDAWLRHMSRKPHHVGSTGSREVAEYIAGLLGGWGYEVEMGE